MDKERIESIFSKITASFNIPVYIEKTGLWVFNNIGKKIPSAFWGIWRQFKEAIKEQGFNVYRLEDSLEGKAVYEITFRSSEKDVDFPAVIMALKSGLENGQ